MRPLIFKNPMYHNSLLQGRWFYINLKDQYLYSIVGEPDAEIKAFYIDLFTFKR